MEAVPGPNEELEMDAWWTARNVKASIRMDAWGVVGVYLVTPLGFVCEFVVMQIFMISQVA